MQEITRAQIEAAQAAAAEVSAASKQDYPLVSTLASAFIAGMRAARMQATFTKTPLRLLPEAAKVAKLWRRSALW